MPQDEQVSLSHYFGVFHKMNRTRGLTGITQAQNVISNLVVVVSLVQTLISSFGSAREIYKELKRKEKKVEEKVECFDEQERERKPLRRRRRDDYRGEALERLGWRSWGRRGRSAEYSDSGEELIETSSTLVTQEYDRGFLQLGQKFAKGDCTALLLPFHLGI